MLTHPLKLAKPPGNYAGGLLFVVTPNRSWDIFMPEGLYVKPEVHYIAIAHYVFLAFYP